MYARELARFFANREINQKIIPHIIPVNIPALFFAALSLKTEI